MYKTLLWIIVMFVLTGINFVGYGISNKYLVFDLSISIVLGVLVATVNRLISKYHTSIIKVLLISVILGLLAVPFVLHYELFIKILDIVYTQQYLPYQIFIESIVYALKVSVFVTILSFLLACLIKTIKQKFVTKNS